MEVRGEPGQGKVARTDRVLTGHCLRSSSKKLGDHGQATGHLVPGIWEEELVLQQVPHRLPVAVWVVMAEEWDRRVGG